MSRSYRPKPTAAKRLLSQAFDLAGATAFRALNAVGRFVRNADRDSQCQVDPDGAGAPTGLSVQPNVNANDPALQPGQGGLEPSTDEVLQATGHLEPLRVNRIDLVANSRRPRSPHHRPRDTDSDETAGRTGASYGDLAFAPRQP